MCLSWRRGGGHIHTHTQSAINTHVRALTHEIPTKHTHSRDVCLIIKCALITSNLIHYANSNQVLNVRIGSFEIPIGPDQHSQHSRDTHAHVLTIANLCKTRTHTHIHTHQRLTEDEHELTTATDKLSLFARQHAQVAYVLDTTRSSRARVWIKRFFFSRVGLKPQTHNNRRWQTGCFRYRRTTQRRSMFTTRYW